MEDDEEYSYKKYAAGTEKLITEEHEITYGGDDEEYSYTSYADDGAAAAEEEKPTAFGDYIVEEFSAETTMPKLAKFTRIPASVVTYAFVVIYAVVGVLCVAVTHQVIDYLPYIVAGMMIIIGVVRFILALSKREYRTLKTNRTATSLIVAALGVMLLVQKIDPNNDPIIFISIVWGILGLFEGAHAFNHALKRISNGERCVYYLVKGIIECIVAFYLLWDPADAAAHEMHIIVFGAQLIFDAVTMIPPVKAFLAMK